MRSLFTGGMTSLSAFVGCFSLNPLGYPRVAIGSPSAGWHPETLTSANERTFLAGARSVLEEGLEFRRRFRDGGGELEIPDTMWKLTIDGPDQFRLWRPRFSLTCDLSHAPWTDLLELRKEFVPETGRRRFISQRFRRTRNDIERFREIKEMVFARAEVREEFGHDPRDLGMFEHQLTMQFNANVFQRMKTVGGSAIVLNPREPLVDRWKPRRIEPPQTKVNYDAPTPAQGVPVTDPYYPYRVLYEYDPLRDYFRLYMSRREPEEAALSLEMGLRTLWNRIETFVETTDRSFPNVIRKI